MRKLTFSPMKKLCLLTFLVGLSSVSLAKVKVTWQNPDDFRDIRAAEQSQKKFQKRTLKTLEKYLVGLGQKFASDRNIDFTVTDLDLAGEVWPAYTQGIDDSRNLRVVKPIYYPMIKFDYNISDPQGNVIESGSEHIKDMMFQDKLRTIKVRRDPLAHEKRMLKEWFKKQFKKKA